MSRTEKFFGTFIAFSQSPQNFMHVRKKDQLYSLNIWEVTDSEKCGYLNARKLLFQNKLRESTCSRVLKNVDITMAALLSELSIDRTHIEFGEISVSEI